MPVGNVAGERRNEYNSVCVYGLIVFLGISGSSILGYLSILAATR